MRNDLQYLYHRKADKASNHGRLTGQRQSRRESQSLVRQINPVVRRGRCVVGGSTINNGRVLYPA